MEAGRTVEAELLKLNLELLECIGNWDYETYVKLCSSDLTCFEPEAVGNLVEGLDFHKWYFDNLKDGGHPSPTQIMVSPKVRTKCVCRNKPISSNGALNFQPMA